MNEKDIMRKVASRTRLLSKVSGHFDKGDFDTALKIIQDVISDPEVTESHLADFTFFKAAILDSRGDSLEALVLFQSLKDRYPGNPKFVRSARIVVRSVASQAEQLASEDPDSPVLRHYHDILHRTAFAPWFLAYLVARQDVAAGKGDDARARMKALVALSPNDSDYLRSACQIAHLLEDRTWLAELRSRIERLIESQPFRTDLYEILPMGLEIPDAETVGH